MSLHKISHVHGFKIQEMCKNVQSSNSLGLASWHASSFSPRTSPARYRRPGFLGCCVASGCIAKARVHPAPPGRRERKKTATSLNASVLAICTWLTRRRRSPPITPVIPKTATQLLWGLLGHPTVYRAADADNGPSQWAWEGFLLIADQGVKQGEHLQ